MTRLAPKSGILKTAVALPAKTPTSSVRPSTGWRRSVSWVYHLASLVGLGGTRHQTKRRRQRRNRVVTCERFEERAMLAVFIWDGGGSDNHWATPANWVGDVAPASGDDLVFSGAINTNTRNNFTGTSFKSITFASNNFTLTGNSLSLTDFIEVGSGVTDAMVSMNVALASSVSINVVDTSLAVTSVLSGANSLTKTGAGKLILSGISTYSGTTTIANGSLQINDGGSLGSGGVTNNSELIVNRNTNLTFGNAASGTGVLVKQGTGTLTLSGANTYTGGTVISSGTLQVGNSSGSAGTLGTGGVTNHGTLRFNRSGTTTLADVISGSGDLIQNNGTLILAANNTYTGTTTLSAGGTLQVGNGGTTGTLGTGVVTAASGPRNLIFNRSDNPTVANDISGAIHLRQQGGGQLTVAGVVSGAARVSLQSSGSLILTGNNTYSGPTAVEQGTLKIGGNNALGTSPVSVAGTLDLNGYSPTLASLTGTGTVTSSALGTSEITIGDATSFSFSGVIEDGSGIIALKKQGAGALRLYGVNTYTGGTKVTNGSIRVSTTLGSGRLGTGPIVNDGLIEFMSASTTTINDVISGSGSLSVESGILILAADNTYAGTTTIGTGGTIRVGNGGTTGALGTGDIVSAHPQFSVTVIFNRSNNLTVNNDFSGALRIRQQGTGDLLLAGDVSAAASIFQHGPGQLTLSGNNTYTGTTDVSSGSTLVLGSGGSVGEGPVTVDGTLDLNGYSTTLGGLSGSGVVTSTAAGGVTIAIGDSQATSSFSGVIEDGLGTVVLSKIGTGKLTLRGANTYSGGTSIAAGTLSLGGNGVLGAGAIANHGTLAIDSFGTVTIADPISGGGAVDVNTGVLVLTGSNTYTGRTTISNLATLRIGDGGTTGTLGTGDVFGAASLPANLVFNRSNSVVVNNAINGTVNLRQQGTGTLVLGGNSQYFGTTTVDSGRTILAAHDAAIGTSNLVLSGTLDVNGYQLTFGKLSGTGTAQSSAAGGSLNVGNHVTQPYTFSGTLQDGAGTLSLQKLGAGVFTLAGNHSYSGDTVISAGTLKIGSATAAVSGAGKGNYVISGTLDLNAYNVDINGFTGDGTITSGRTGAVTLTVGNNHATNTFSGTINDGVGSVGLSKVGTGEITLAGINSYAGDTIISSGTLSFDRDGLGSGTVHFDGGALRWVTGNSEDISARFAAIGSGKTAWLDTNGNDVSLAADITGSGGLTKWGTGSLTLTGANTYSGITTVAQGAIVASSIVVSGGSSNLGNAATAIILGDASHSGELIYTGTSDTFTRGLTVNAGGGRIETTAPSETLAIATAGIATSGPLTLGGPGNLIVSSVISGTGSLAKLGEGSLTLTGNNTYSGSTTIAQGTLIADSIVVASGSSNLGNATSAVVLGDSQNRGTLSYSGTSTTFTRGLAVGSGGGQVNVTAASQTLTIAAGSVDTTGEWSIGGVGNTSVTANITGTGSLTKVGSGTLVVSGTNSYSGDTTISDGALRIANASAATSGVGKGNWIVDATLDLSGTSITINGLEGVGFITSSQSGSLTLTVGGNNQTSSFDGVIEDGAGVVSMTKTGTGTISLTGFNTHSGDNSLADGTLAFASGSLGSGVIRFDGGALRWAPSSSQDISHRFAPIAASATAILDTGGNDVTLASAISGAGALEKIGPGTLILGGANTYTGGTGIGAGHLQFAPAALPASGVIEIDSDGALNAAGPYGTASDWLASGKVAASSSGALALTTDDSTTISLGGYPDLYLGATASATISGTVIPAGGAYRLGGGSGTLTVSSTLGDSGGATALQARGQLVLSATNTYTGGTVLNDGTLSISSNSAVGGAGSNLVFAGGVLQVTGTALTSLGGHTVNWSTFDGGFDIASPDNLFTISQNLSGGGNLVKRGAGSLLLSGNNTYNGDTVVSAGTLVIGSPYAVPNGVGKGNLSVDGTLDLSGYSLSVNGLAGTGVVTSTQVGLVTLTVGGNDQTSTFAGTIEDGDGTIALAKIGSGTLSLAGNSTYTGNTDVQAGILVLDGNLNSHVTTSGGTVSGWFFRDPDLAAAIRQSLGMPPNAILTPNDLDSLYNLTLDSNLISDLKGLENAPNLYSLTVIPRDFSVAGSLANAEFSASLQWLSDLANLEILVLQGTGLTDASLQTLGGLSSLHTLDVRYNELVVIPESILELPSLSSLLVYGNSALTDAPRAGLQHLAGELIHVDLAPDHPEQATTIAELADALYNLPIGIYEYLVNTIQYVPYVGAMKGPLAVLQTGKGNAWDTASLLAALYVEAGAVEETNDLRTQDYHYASGRIQLPIHTAMGYLGATTPEAAEQIAETAGLNPERVLDGGSEWVGLVFDHAWLEAKLGGQQWVSLDPSWKFQHIRSDGRDILDDVAWDTDLTTADYFATVRPELPSEFYEAQVRGYLAANEPWLSIANLVYAGPIVVQTIDSMPQQLPYALWDDGQPWDPQSNDPRPIQTFAAIPEAMTHRLRVILQDSFGVDEHFDSGFLSVADISLSPLIIRPTLEWETWVRPELLLGDQTIVQAKTALKSNDAIKISIEYYEPGAMATPSKKVTHGAAFFESIFFAGNYYALMVDAGQVSHSLLKEQRRVVNQANVDFSDGQPLDADSAIGGLLHLANLEYISQLDTAAESILGITAAKRDASAVGFGLAIAAGTNDAFYRPDTQTPYRVRDLAPELAAKLHIPVLPERYIFDLSGVALGSVSIADDDTNAIARAHVISHTSSVLEHAVWEGLTNADAMSTIKSLQLAGERDIPIVEIPPHSSQSTINGLLSFGVFGSSIVASIADYSALGHTVWVPKTYTDLGDWRGVGYFVEKTDGMPAAYIISGGLNGGMNTGDSKDPNAPPDGEDGTQDKSPDPIIFANGTLTHDETDFVFPGLGATLGFARHYRSSQTGELIYDSDRGMGDGWSFTYSDRLETSADPADPVGTKIWFTDNGVRRRFLPDGLGGYITPDANFGTLTDHGSGLGFSWVDTQGNVVRFSDSDGNGISRLESMADRYGNGVLVAYDGSGQITTVTDLVTPSRWVAFTYTGGKITAVSDFTGRTWSYGYDAGRLTSATKPSDVNTPQGVVQYEYHSSPTLDGLLKKVINPNGRATEFSYYPNRWGFEVKFAEGDVQSIWYNPHRNQTAYVDERNIATYYTFNGDGNTVEELFADRTTHAFGWADNLNTAFTDAFGQTESYQYDSDGNLITLTDRLGYVTAYAYTDYANLLSVTRYNGPGSGDDQVTTYSYLLDGFGKDDKLHEITDAEGNVTRFAYEGADGARGLVTSMVSPRGTVTTGDPDDYVTQYSYNTAGQILTVTARAAVAVPIVETITYDARGLVLSSTNANGNVTTYTYDLLDRLLTTTLPDPDGIGGNPAPTTSLVYDFNGNLLSSTLITALSSRQMNYAYDTMNRLTRIENPDGTYRTLQYDMLSKLVAETDELGRVTRYIYDNRSRVIATITPDGHVTASSYDGGGRVVSTTDPLGNTTIQIHDALDRLTKTIDAQGGETTRVYDHAGNLYSVTDARGRSTVYYYDLLNRLTTIIEPDPDGAGPLAVPMTWFYYDENSNLSAQVDPLGRTTVYVHDEIDRLIMLIEPDPDGAGPLFSPVTHYTLDAVGNLLAVTDPLGNVTAYAYDALNRTTTVTGADPDYGGPQTSPITTYHYDAIGNLAAVVDPLGRETAYAYDLRNNLVRLALPAPYGVLYSESPVYEYSYDAVGNQVSVIDPLGVATWYAFDNRDRLTTITTIDQAVSRFEYDAAGNRTRAIDPLQRATVYAYDQLHRLVAVTDPRNETTSLGYDLVGNQTWLLDPNGNLTEFVYDGLDRTIERTDPLLQSTFYHYDAVGNLTETVDRNGRVREFAYDGLDRLTTETWLDGVTVVNTLSFDYDLVGNLLAAADDFSVYAFSYDNLYRLIQSDNDGTPDVPNVILVHGYDAVGNQTSTSDNTGVTVVSVYDGLNRLGDRSWDGGTIDEALVRFGYTSRSERTAAYRYADLAGTQTVSRSSYSNDALGRVGNIGHFDALDAVLAEYDYTYDLASQITGWSHHGETIDFTHDAAGQLTSADYLVQADEDFAYDANGNRTGNGMLIGDNNQVLSDGTYDYQYDSEGNLVLKTEIASGDYVEYEYDHRNRLVLATSYSAGNAVLQVVEFTYDLFDRRIAKAVDAVSVYTVYHGDHAWADFDETGDALARYLFGDGIDEIIARWTPGEGTAWYLTDHLGSVRDLVDNAGDLINTITYDSFGGIVVQTNPAAGDRFTYTGREYDAEIDLYYYRARFYDANLGRFVSQDPIGFAAGDPNLYRYVGNRVDVFIDPSGLDWLDTAANFSAGWADALSFGATNVMRDAMGTNGGIDYGSSSYTAGTYTGVVHSMAMGTGGAQAGVVARGYLAGSQAVGRVQGGIDSAKHLGSAVGKLLDGDWSGAGKSGLKAIASLGLPNKGKGGKPSTKNNMVPGERPAPKSTPKEILVDPKKHPESVQHLEDAGAMNRPLTVNRGEAASNRADALRGKPKVPGRDLDEAPPAVLRQPGDPVSVQPISPGDNRGAGASIGNQLRNVPDGGQVIIRPKPGN